MCSRTPCAAFFYKFTDDLDVAICFPIITITDNAHYGTNTLVDTTNRTPHYAYTCCRCLVLESFFYLTISQPAWQHRPVARVSTPPYLRLRDSLRFCCMCHAKPNLFTRPGHGEEERTGNNNERIYDKAHPKNSKPEARDRARRLQPWSKPRPLIDNLSQTNNSNNTTHCVGLPPSPFLASGAIVLSMKYAMHAWLERARLHGDVTPKLLRSLKQRGGFVSLSLTLIPPRTPY